MQQEQDEQTMNQVDGMIKLIDKESKGQQAAMKSQMSAEKPQSKSSGGQAFTSIFRDLKNQDEEHSRQSYSAKMMKNIPTVK